MAGGGGLEHQPIARHLPSPRCAQPLNAPPPPPASPTHAHTPHARAQTLMDLEDFLAATLGNKELVKTKMSSSNSKALNTMRQRLKKHNLPFADQIAAFRENPVVGVGEGRGLLGAVGSGGQPPMPAAGHGRSLSRAHCCCVASPAPPP